MVWPRLILSAVVLIVTNLIVGSISLSLSLIVIVILAGMLIVGLVLLSILGMCVLLEKMNWLSTGWTDAKIERLKEWAIGTWRGMPMWYREQKLRIIAMLVQMLKEKEAPLEQGTVTMKSVVVALIILLAIVLVKYSFHLSVGWSIALVAVGSVIAAIPIVYMQGRLPKDESTAERSESSPVELSSLSIGVEIEELTAALKDLVALHRTGRLAALLETPHVATQVQLQDEGPDNARR